MLRKGRVVRGIWAACLLIAGANHARILLQHGLQFDYGGVALPSALYWTSLALLDPLVAALLFVRPTWGIVGTVMLIATNVAHNLTIVAQRAPEGELFGRVAFSPILLSQIAFLAFVAATARIAWRGAVVRQAAAGSG